MLTIFRRHLKACPQTSRDYRRCRCPIHVEGTLAGVAIRKGLDLTSWEAAQALVREWETTGKIGGVAAPDLREAAQKYEADAIARGVQDSTMVLIRRVLAHFLAWCEEKGLRRLSEISVERARDYRATWTYKPITAAKKLERLKAFFRFCTDAGWIDKSPFVAVRPPVLRLTPTQPFTDGEFTRLVAACDKFSNKGVHGFSTGKRIKAFILLLRYSGLRRTDAVSLHRDRLSDGKVFLYTQKTGTPVWVPIPPFVAELMEEVRQGEHFFWSGNGGLKAATSSWDRAFRKLCKLAGVKGHFHMLRDTFAVSLLLKGTPIEDVAILLGHSDVAITQKHYSPWIRARQERLEERVKATWDEPRRLRVIQGEAS